MSNPAADRSLSVDNQIVPESLRCLTDPSRELPRLAKNRSAMAAIEAAVVEVPTRHQLLLGDARLAALPAESVHLVVTSPPYWVLKEYRRADGQLGWIEDYEELLPPAEGYGGGVLRSHTTPQRTSECAEGAGMTCASRTAG